jgi:hypothetical protein
LRPAMVSRRLMFSSAVPKRVDIDAALKDIIGTSFAPCCTSRSAAANAFSKVQKEPVMQKPIRMPSSDILCSPFIQNVRDCSGDYLSCSHRCGFGWKSQCPYHTPVQLCGSFMIYSARSGGKVYDKRVFIHYAQKLFIKYHGRDGVYYYSIPRNIVRKSCDKLCLIACALGFLRI